MRRGILLAMAGLGILASGSQGAIISIAYDGNYQLGNAGNAPQANLTTAGPTDWAFWDNSFTANQEKSGAAYIGSTLTVLDPGGIGTTGDEPSGWRMIWTDGSPTASGNGQGGMHVHAYDSGAGAVPNLGLSMDVDVSALDSGVLKLYLGAYEAGAKMRAFIVGYEGSAVELSSAAGMRNTNQNAAANWSYSVTFDAAPGDAVLRVQWIQDYDDGNYDNVWLSGAALNATLAVPEPASLWLLALGGIGLLARRR